MPHMRIRGVEREVVQRLSTRLVDQLAALIQSPKAHFTLEWLQTEFIMDGQTQPGYPFVELLWFERPQALQDQVAQLITAELKAELGEAQEVAVVILPLARERYYDNGQHY